MADTNGSSCSAHGALSHDRSRGARSGKVWATLITNMSYLPGLLTLDFSLKLAKSEYALVALYTDAFSLEGRQALDTRNIARRQIPHLTPRVQKKYVDDARFNDCWTKLAAFGLTDYERVVLLDSDMLVLKNMDELMDLPLDSPALKGTGSRVFAAGHACVCNPIKKPHYPKDWIPENCAFTAQHAMPAKAQIKGSPSSAGLGKLNSGLLVFEPCNEVYDAILTALDSDGPATYAFPDQDLLGDVFEGRWVGLPYIYNALKTMRTPGVHDKIWRDEKVKNVHYILSPKPWEETREQRRKRLESQDFDIHEWWWEMNEKRLLAEESNCIVDEV
jgi:alpha-N-acetylglucosamine transferase